MRAITFILVCLAFSALSKEISEILSKPTPIVILTEEDFNGKVNPSETGNWFIMFYIPNCPHCKEAMPLWEEFAYQQVGKVNVAVINAAENKNLTRRFDVSNFPTFYFFAGNKMYEHDGIRTVEEWTKFVTEDYKQETALDIPSGPQDHNRFLKPIKHIYKQTVYLIKHKPLVLGAFIAIAIVTTALAIWCTSFLSDKLETLKEETDEKLGEEIEKGKVKPKHGSKKVD